MNEKLIAYARLVAIAASQQQLSDEVAQLFCKEAIPQLLAEIEVLNRVNARFDALLQPPKPEPAPVVAPQKPARKARKARKKKARAK